MSDASPSTNTIEVVSDTICPWCYIGLRRIQRALTSLPASAGTFVIRHLPFQLNPGMPIEGIPRKQYRTNKFGSWERSLALDEQVANSGRADGLTFRHDLATRTPNTLASHVLIHLANEDGVQASVVEAVFRGYFTQGKDIGDVNVLASLAREAGMQRAGLADVLQDTALRSHVAKRADQAASSGITGVPSFRLDGAPLASGAQAPEMLSAAILAALERGNLDSQST